MRFTGVIGEGCLSLTTGVERARTGTGYTQTQTVIATHW